MSTLLAPSRKLHFVVWCLFVDGDHPLAYHDIGKCLHSRVLRDIRSNMEKQYCTEHRCTITKMARARRCSEYCILVKCPMILVHCNSGIRQVALCFFVLFDEHRIYD